MVDKSELLASRYSRICRTIRLDWFISQSEELQLKAGETYSRQGDPADAMFVVLEGQLQGRGEIGGETVTFTHGSGRRYRSAAVFEDEAVYGERPSSRPIAAPCDFRPRCFPIWCRRCRN